MKHLRIMFICGCTLLAVLLASQSASAFSLFGWTFSQAAVSSPAAPSADNVQSTANQADAVIDDITANANVNTCLRFSNHEYEVCSAYVFNSAIADLVPYYKYAHSGNQSVERFVTYRLGSRYVGNANTVIQNRVAGWPSGELEVDVPDITILSVTSDLVHNSATLQTQETWHVTDSLGDVVYEENNTVHTVTLARVPSYLLHKWVVTNLTTGPL